LEDLPRIEEDGESWLRRPKLYERVVERHKKEKKKKKKRTMLSEKYKS
jgi:hypothetical protein